MEKEGKTRHKQYQTWHFFCSKCTQQSPLYSFDRKNGRVRHLASFNYGKGWRAQGKITKNCNTWPLLVGGEDRHTRHSLQIQRQVSLEERVISLGGKAESGWRDIWAQCFEHAFSKHPACFHAASKTLAIKSQWSYLIFLGQQSVCSNSLPGVI